MLIGLDQTDQHGVDQHVVRRELVRERLGHRHAGGARHRGRHAVAARRLGADVEHVDDAAPAPLLHLRRDQTNHADRREQLLLKVVMQDLVGELLERRGARGAGVVDQDVDLAEAFHRLVIGARDIGRDPDVRDHADDLAVGLLLEGGDRLLERSLAARDDGNIGAGGGKALRHRKADTLAAAGDDGGTARKTDFHDKTPCDPVPVLAPPRRTGRAGGSGLVAAIGFPQGKRENRKCQPEPHCGKAKHKSEIDEVLDGLRRRRRLPEYMNRLAGKALEGAEPELHGDRRDDGRQQPVRPGEQLTQRAPKRDGLVGAHLHHHEEDNRCKNAAPDHASLAELVERNAVEAQNHGGSRIAESDQCNARRCPQQQHRHIEEHTPGQHELLHEAKLAEIGAAVRKFDHAAGSKQQREKNRDAFHHHRGQHQRGLAINHETNGGGEHQPRNRFDQPKRSVGHVRQFQRPGQRHASKRHRPSMTRPRQSLMSGMCRI